MAILRDYYDTADGSSSQSLIDNTNDWIAQTFTPSVSYAISSIELYAYVPSGHDIGTLTVSIKAVDSSSHPSGADLASGTIASGSFGSSPSWISCSFSSTANLSGSTMYAIVIRASAADASNKLYWNARTSPTYSGGQVELSTDGGSSWTGYVTHDSWFKTYGGPVVPVDKGYSRSLVAIGNHEVWYESAAGTMSELSAANYGIDCSLPLEVSEAFQKLFIANKTNSKIADFVNVKLPTGEIGASSVSAPLKGLTLTGDTSGATMVADFCGVATGSAYVYGYKTSTASFVSGDTVTGGASNTVSFSMVSAQVDAPHWYDWTPQHNDTTTFGSMPSSADLVCLYRGRLVLAGNPDYPHQWYMSRVLDPFDWKYVVNDPLSPVRGGDADAGQIGDIIKVLIPYQDDYLLVGCANSWHIIRGDPAWGGSRDLLSDETGIFGDKAWCFDDSNNLYFYGKNGLYKIPVGAGVPPPENISELALPEWVSDWGLDISKHRVVLTYDFVRKGLLVSKTTLADGSNDNYFYDFKAGGFFPEEYPDDCGIYSSHFYNATNPTYRGLLLGCKDGYVRKFNDSAKDDTTSASTAIAIDSYCVLPITQIAADEMGDAKVKSLSVVNAGGASGGEFSDTDNLNIKLYIGDNPEEVLEDIQDVATAVISATISGSGRRNKLGLNVRTSYLGVKAYNSAVGETWALEKIFGEANQLGGK